MNPTEVERAEGIEFHFTESEPDGGGSLRIVGTSDKVKEELCEMFRRNEPKATKYAPLASAEPMEIVLSPRDTRNDGREAWYAFPCALDCEWFDPYRKQLERMTGFKGEIGDFSIPDPRMLCYTRHRAALRFEDGHVQATIYVSAHPWNKMDALTYGHKRAEMMFQSDIGEEPIVREFIENRNGTYSRNPQYPNPLPPRPALRCEYLWGALWEWWLANRASEAQKAILAACVSEERTGRYSFGFRSMSSLYVSDPAGPINWDGKGRMVRSVSWDEFAALA